GLTALSAEFTIGEGELMAHDVPLGCAPDEYDDLISGTCSHLPQVTEGKRQMLGMLCAFAALLCWSRYAVENSRCLKNLPYILDVNYLGRYASTTLAAFELFLS
ncbi:hypothetical protein VSR99_26185, partial [Klebsiella pneumoniae]|nr:hypothetical protein [Klebsiella pneumoniae]